MTRLWPQGLPVTVQTDASGLPACLIWDHQPHPIAHIANRWRLAWGWWRWPVQRDVFKVVAATGLLLDIYRDQLTDEWYVQRLYD